jgi:type II secretion system protein N
MMKSILFACYILVATAVCLYVLFPSEAAKKYVAIYMQQINPELHMKMERIRPSFPPGLRIDSGSLHYRDEPVFDSEKIKIVPHILTLFNSEKKVALSSKTSDGTIGGTLAINKNGAVGHILFSGGMNGINLKNVPLIRTLTQHTISGICNGNISYSSDEKSKGTFSAQLTLSECTVEFHSPVYGLESLAFGQVQADVTVSKERIVIKSGQLKGQQLDGSFSGIVTLRDSVGECILNLAGILKPHHAFLAADNHELLDILYAKKNASQTDVSFRINGPFDTAMFLFN